MKRIIALCTFFLFYTVCFSQTIQETTVYKVGDIGPAGGIICYDKGEYSDGWRYLEVAPPETEFNAPWSENDVQGTKENTGSGKKNTRLLVEQLNMLGETGTAAQLCDSLVYNGYDDWFLPSILELFRASYYFELDRIYIKDWYWSSTQSSGRYAFAQRYSGNHQGIYLKKYTNRVRAVRYF